MRLWLLKEAKRQPEDKELRWIAGTLDNPQRDETDRPNAVLDEYLQAGLPATLNRLRFWPNSEVLDALSGRLARGELAGRRKSILRLLKAYENRHRATIVDIVLTHWQQLSDADYGTTVEVLTGYPVATGQKRRAVAVLNRELSGVHGDAARRGLEHLLR